MTDQVYIRCDGARLAPEDLAETIPVHWNELEEIASPIRLFVYWLHLASQETLNELEAFLVGNGYQPGASGLIEHLDDIRDRLERLIDMTRPATNPPF